jgi:hypothetical protein
LVICCFFHTNCVSRDFLNKKQNKDQQQNKSNQKSSMVSFALSGSFSLTKEGKLQLPWGKKQKMENFRECFFGWFLFHEQKKKASEEE